jgi:hypothetical protein
MSNATKLTESDLHEFTGTETWYRHSLNRKVVYTEGVPRCESPVGMHAA